jgi:hypothetical protein
MVVVDLSETRPLGLLEEIEKLKPTVIGITLVLAFFWGRGSAFAEICFIAAFFVLLALYVNSRYLRRSLNIEREAILSIEAEPAVAWRVLDMNEELVKEGTGSEQLSVPVSFFSKSCSLPFLFVPKKWHSWMKQSRLFGYKPSMSYIYIVEKQNEADVLNTELRLDKYSVVGENLEVFNYPLLLIWSPIYNSRHWIWPDWFEIFSPRAEQL